MAVVGGWQVAVAAREVGGDRGPQVGCRVWGDADQAQLTNSRLEEILSVAAAVGAGVVMGLGGVEARLALAALVKCKYDSSRKLNENSGCSLRPSCRLASWRRG
jgi:hypothetical protein